MNPKQTSIFFFFLLIIPISYGITLEELLASYDFSYSDGTIDITNINHYGNNHSTSLYDQLIFNVTLNSENSGIYEFITTIKDISISNNIPLRNGINQIHLVFNPKHLTNNNYNLSLSINKDQLNIYDQPIQYEFAFDNTFFEKNEYTINEISHELIGQPIHTLRLKLNVSSTINKNTNISVFLSGNSKVISKNINTNLQPGNNQINIDLEASKIKNNRITELNLYKINIDNYQFENNYLINNYQLNNLQSQNSMILNTVREYDITNNNLTEKINLEIELDIKTSNTYTLKTSIYNEYNEFINDFNQSYQLSPGINKVNFSLEGTKFYSSNIDGPYILKYLNLNNVDSIPNFYTTNPYHFSDFIRPPRPDLEITINNNIIVTNIGDIPAFNVILEIITDNETITLQYPILNINQQIIIPKLNNSFTAIIDLDNIIDESDETNNIARFIPEPRLSLVGIPRIGSTVYIDIEDQRHPYMQYILALSASGTNPGIQLTPNILLKLNYDMILDYSLFYPYLLGLHNSSGYLDSNGKARVIFNIPNLPFLTNFDFYSNFITINNTNILSTGKESIFIDFQP